MEYTHQISIIVPHRDAIKYLPKLFSSIPDDKRIEIIIVDNTPTPVTKDDIGINREYLLLWSDPIRFAGGARNVGVDNAHGKWLLFLDADDYYAEGAIDLFISYVNSEADVIYTGMGGVYSDTGEPANRGDYYRDLVRAYLSGEKSELDLRFGFASPCCKMIRHSIVKQHNIRFDEIFAGNDIYFSTLVGYYSRKIVAIDFVSYIATVNRGSLTQRRDFEAISARLYSKLHCNKFLREHGYPERQHSVMFAMYEALHMKWNAFFKFCFMIIKFRQNPFIGFSGWLKTLKAYSNKIKNNKKYITK